MNIDTKNLKEILLKGSYITEDDAKKAEDFAKSRNSSFLEYLFSEGLISNDLLGQAIAEYYGISYSDLSAAGISSSQVLLIPEDVAKKYRVILFGHVGKDELVFSTDNPKDPNLEAELLKVFPNKKIKIAYSLPEDIDALFVYYQKSLETRFSKIIEKRERIAPEILEEIFEDALLYKASDIHFEPQSESVLIRFRVDGVLREAGRIPKEFYENILNRIKVKSGLRIDEHFSAQDGSLRFENENGSVDMRTSIVPTILGEKVVLRVLASYIQNLTLAEIGLSSINEQVLEEASKKPFGMILVVGPTGSGKTTTLYALLKTLNSPEENITTIEDPVEYRMQGVNQIQVDTETNLTFAKGLRSIVRQDPDTILVGEIRDEETAEIAVNAALTGHLLLSTFHANDAATAIPRLLDMGIEPFLLASTLELVIAQRLVRKICDNCRHSIVKDRSDFNTFELKSVLPYVEGDNITVYEGKGCESCNHTGYKGRTSIFEFIKVTPAMQDLISDKPSTSDIWKLARKEGAITLFEDGILKVKNGITTISEVLRVAEAPKDFSKK